MISLTCTSCQKTLEIDPAFAGGVCRCRFCGTIQTVPAALKNGANTATPARTLYEKKKRGPNQSSGNLDELADAVASSSGLARSGLKSRAPAPAAPQVPRRNLLPVFVAISAILLVVVAILLVLLLLQ